MPPQLPSEGAQSATSNATVASELDETFLACSAICHLTAQAALRGAKYAIRTSFNIAKSAIKSVIYGNITHAHGSVASTAADSYSTMVLKSSKIPPLSSIENAKIKDKNGTEMAAKTLWESGPVFIYCIRRPGW